MVQFTWTFDAPTGTYKQHALARKLYMAAVENSVFVDHVRPVDGFGKNKGESVTLTRVKNITEPTSADLDELMRIPEGRVRPQYQVDHRQGNRPCCTVHVPEPGPLRIQPG